MSLELNSLERMCCPWWERHQVAVIKMAYSDEQRLLLVNIFYQTFYIMTYQPIARQQLSVHGSSEHATMGAVFSVDHATAHC
jgi:hypothetical protein